MTTKIRSHSQKILRDALLACDAIEDCDITNRLREGLKALERKGVAVLVKDNINGDYWTHVDWAPNQDETSR
jgi:hypothetical protein